MRKGFFFFFVARSVVELFRFYDAMCGRVIFFFVLVVARVIY